MSLRIPAVGISVGLAVRMVSLAVELPASVQMSGQPAVSSFTGVSWVSSSAVG